MKYQIQKIEFPLYGELIRGSLYLPKGTETSGPLPAVVLAHGWGMTAGGDLEDYAHVIAERNIICLTIDFRNLGASTGEPRQHVNPFQQIEDLRSALDYLQQRPEVDENRLGVWGSSYAGGHVIAVAGIDCRVRAAVAQVPTISGYQAKAQTLSSEQLRQRSLSFINARLQRQKGVDIATVQTVSNQNEPCAYPDQASYDYMSKQAERCINWRNYTTLASLDLAHGYEPNAYLYRIKEVAFLMIITTQDTTTPTNLQKEAFKKIPSANKKLVILEGDHYAVYQEEFELSSIEAADWFAKKL